MSDAAEQTLVAEWRELLARHAVVSGALEAELQRQHGIGVSEFEALEQIATCGEGKCRAARLSDAVHLSQSAASRLVARLERAGLVQRAMCEMDRRGIFVTPRPPSPRTADGASWTGSAPCRSPARRC
jgi:DNA-binding MarR family transcriptional regulator